MNKTEPACEECGRAYGHHKANCSFDDTAYLIRINSVVRGNADVSYHQCDVERELAEAEPSPLSPKLIDRIMLQVTGHTVPTTNKLVVVLGRIGIALFILFLFFLMWVV